MSHPTSIKSVLLLNGLMLLGVAYLFGGSRMIPDGDVVPDRETALKVAEAILFRQYGEDTIRKERPYKVALKNGNWVLDGTLPEFVAGGTFHIVISQKDAQVLELWHLQ